MLKLLSIFLGLVLLAGCTHKPSANDMAEADYGRVPNLYKEMIISKINESLANPESAKIDVSRPYPAIRYLGISKGGKYEYGHVVHVWVSTRNGSGKYTQRSPRIYWWSNTGWSAKLPSLEGVTPKYPEQAEEYSGIRFTSY
ncbi:MAG: hypothetical protein JSU60_00040 [Nitrospirota bacterium]|nr:MAG: hypothetical protein JSU60_00040 [Nitrospirota bacterium]